MKYNLVEVLRDTATLVAQRQEPVLFSQQNEPTLISIICRRIASGGFVETEDLARLIHYIADMMEQ